MGEHFSSSSRDLVGSFLHTWQNILHILIMKFFAIIAFVGYTQAFLVRREAAPDADAEPGYGYGAVSPRAVSAPVCNSVPEKVCKDRTIETPRKVCHTEHDEIVDTTITEHCEEVITTKCEQTSTQSRHSSAIVGQDSKVVATGVVASPAVTVAHGVPAHGVSGYGTVATGPVVSTVGAGAVVGGVVGGVAGYGVAGYGVAGYGKREADADADADADAGYGYASPVSTSAPICRSVPVRHCNQVPVNRPRKVAKTVCKTVVDIKIIKDCTDTISTTCTQQSVQQSHSSAVVGTNSRDGPYAVVANHGTVSVGASTTPIGAAPIGGYTSGAVIGGGAVIGATAPIASGYIGGATGGLAAPIISSAAPVIAAAPVVAAAPFVAAAPVAAVPLAVAAAPALVSHPNGALVPAETPDVAAARAEHLKAVAAAQ